MEKRNPDSGTGKGGASVRHRRQTENVDLLPVAAICRRLTVGRPLQRTAAPRRRRGMVALRLLHRPMRQRTENQDVGCTSLQITAFVTRSEDDRSLGGGRLVRTPNRSSRHQRNREYS